MAWKNILNLQRFIHNRNKESKKTILFDGIQNRLIEEIRMSTRNIQIAVTWFTNNEIFGELLRKLEFDNIHIQLIVLNDSINNKLRGNDFQKFIELGGEFFFSEVTELVHHKFCIIDSTIVITGSYNWTYYAEKRNWENVVILKNKLLVDQFKEEFETVLGKHKRITNLEDEFLYMSSIDSNNYLRWEYQIQLDGLLAKNLKIKAARLLNDILREGGRDTRFSNQQRELLKELNTEEKYTVCPFEIGMTFKDGYSVVIPSLQELPFSVELTGTTVINNQEEVSTDIIKKERFKDIKLTIGLSHIKKGPQGAQKVKYTFTLDQKGELKIKAEELNGYDRVVEKIIDIRSWG